MTRAIVSQTKGLKTPMSKIMKLCALISIVLTVLFDGYSDPNGHGNCLMTGATIFSAVGVNRYICCHCGYTEEWIDREELKKIKSSKKAKSV